MEKWNNKKMIYILFAKPKSIWKKSNNAKDFFFFFFYNGARGRQGRNWTFRLTDEHTDIPRDQ